LGNVLTAIAGGYEIAAWLGTANAESSGRASTPVSQDAVLALATRVPCVTLGATRSNAVCRALGISIWLVTRRRCSSRFDLGGNTLELLEQLVRGNIRQNESTAHNPAYFRGLTSRRFFKSRLCESYDEIAMDHGNSSNFVCEYFPFVERVF
jgi:hypothetical protein